MGTLLPSNLQSLFKFHHFPIISFLETNPILFSWHICLSPVHIGSILPSLLDLNDLTFLKIVGQLFYSMSLNWGLSDFSS